MRAGRIEFDQPTEPWGALEVIRKQVVLERGKPAGSFTAGEYAARYDLPTRTADEQLKRLLRTGKLESKRVLLNSRITNVYWIPEVQPCRDVKRSTSGRTSTRKRTTGGLGTRG